MRYLIHYFDGAEHLRRSEALDCRDDAEAVAHAALRVHPFVIEVWQGDRQVRRFEAEDRLPVAC